MLELVLPRAEEEKGFKRIPGAAERGETMLEFLKAVLSN